MKNMKNRTNIFYFIVLAIMILLVSGCNKGDTSDYNGVSNYFSGLGAESNYLISPNDFVEKLKSHPSDIYLLDIRKEEDYNEEHIAGAEHCWWFDVDKIIPKLPKDKTIVVYCYTGQSAGQVVGVLRTAGFKAISLTGGYDNGWKPYLESPSEYTCRACEQYSE